ncbi:MAG: YwaF family protein [Clostridia bacterium]|nr:YwaF family protein [Clostridia bacterium]
MMGDWIEAMMAATAWGMEKPEAYGPFHLIATGIGLALSIFLAYRLRGISERGNRILLFSVGMFLLLTEAYKQLFHTFYLSEHTYNYSIFPFQLCSVPMYLCIITAFLKDGRLRQGMFHFMTTYNLLGGLISFAEPSGLSHAYVTLTLHAFVWHMTLVFVGLYLIASGRYAKTWADYRSATVTFLVLAVIAFGINLIFWEPSGGKINMFFVGPRNSSLAVFKDIAKAYGWYVSTALYLPAVCLGALLVFWPAHRHAKYGRILPVFRKKTKTPTTEN